MGNMHLITGFAGAAHITSADHGSYNAATIGKNSYVLDRGNKFSASAIDINLIRVLDGDILLQGRHIRIDDEAFVDLTIENGEQGMLRNDLIVCRYSKDEITTKEEANLVVIKGTSAASNPSDPEYISGNLLDDHDLTTDFPLWRVRLNSLEIREIEPLFDVLGTLESVHHTLESLHNDKQDRTELLPESAVVDESGEFPFYDPGTNQNKKTTVGTLERKITDTVMDQLPVQRLFFTESCTWTPPHDSVYTITLLGGGGGGGSGFGVRDNNMNSNSNFSNNYFFGEGGAASVPVTKRMALYANETYTFTIGKGGAGRTGSSYVMTAKGGYVSPNPTPPTFSSGDFYATSGGETSMKLGDTVLLETSQRVKSSGYGWCAYNPASTTSNISLQSGCSGSSPLLSGTRNSVTVTINSFQAVSGAGRLGGGKGGDFVRSSVATAGGNATGYGCGGGGGAAPCSTASISGSRTTVYRGGNGGDGYALIEWGGPLTT